MNYDAEIIENLSSDPYYKIRFTYESEGVFIEQGYAEVIRRAPMSEINYGNRTNEILGNEDKSKLNLELLNTVINYILLSSKSLQKQQTFKLHAL